MPPECSFRHQTLRFVRHPLDPKKSLGQNFLNDPNTARKIAGTLFAGAGASVVEIGPGTGALTEQLLDRCDDLTVIEVDERAVTLLREKYSGLDVRHADVLEVDWPALAREKGGALHVIGNLPYYITSPILFALLDAREHLAEAVLTMQLEVAERLTAEPHTKAYGIPSVLTQLYARPELLFEVSRHVFYPKPRVTSAVVRLTFGDGPGDRADVDPGWVRTIVRAAFNKRRKMLRNSLRTWTKDRGIPFPDDWGRLRAEALSPAMFLELARYLRERNPEATADGA